MFLKCGDIEDRRISVAASCSQEIMVNGSGPGKVKALAVFSVLSIARRLLEVQNKITKLNNASRINHYASAPLNRKKSDISFFVMY